ncbi:WXG100 family type VII secretion target [Phytomonospora endophytica]|uniref:ESAT-6-like protein n=1 Tax=Phytomonospora endophytica TaxID=714109 RepID=A0A841FG77_9ACTN|nr:WXG100 family type VII secretion target [Phytomonospora endophytica]MBB6032848.1 WXG100 family type VII secretion target [Phytomonospora endophytica]GIG65074.1 hypothetical protein Pen01_13690 [Phytomonospora endophytica]
MSDRILVDYAQMEESAGQMKKLAGEIQGEVEDLKSKLGGLDWEGADKEAYQAQQTEMDTSIIEIKELLEAIAGAVDQANSNYQATEGANAKAWG